MWSHLCVSPLRRRFPPLHSPRHCVVHCTARVGICLTLGESDGLYPCHPHTRRTGGRGDASPLNTVHRKHCRHSSLPHTSPLLGHVRMHCAESPLLRVDQPSSIPPPTPIPPPAPSWLHPSPCGATPVAFRCTVLDSTVNQPPPPPIPPCIRIHCSVAPTPPHTEGTVM